MRLKKRKKKCHQSLYKGLIIFCCCSFFVVVIVLFRCVCVCGVFFRFILDIKFVGRTSRCHTGGRSHRISHPLSFCSACLSFSREKDSALFRRRPCSRILSSNDLIILHPLGTFIFVFIYIFSEKNPVYRDRTRVPTRQKVTRLPLSYRFFSRWSFVDVPLIYFCPADHVPDWQPRILLGMVEARLVKAVVVNRK